jgi:hypothetical protein
MKKNIIISIISIIFSLAFVNSFNDSCKSEDYTMNQIGGYLIYEGVTNESSISSNMGGAIASLGGGALVNSAGLAWGATWAIGSNPIGWAIAGVGLVL